jgi:spore coat protein CotH
MRYLFLLILLAFTGIPKNLLSQADFYAVDSVREVRIYFTESNWDYILDSLYVAGDQDRLRCAITIDGAPYDSIGIRYKGFSSASTTRTKNPFNIKLDYLINGQNHDGIDKLKLGNVIQDPSFVREVLSYEIARKYMPASYANYAEVYINDVYWGLYSNVQTVADDFLNTAFGSSHHAFFKGNPESLDLNGENANLGNSPGTDSMNYEPLYGMKSDYGWSDLYDLIDTLNDHSTEIESILNVDRTLWMHAFNYSVVNFDSYVGYAQNYYLYRDHNGQFNPILWDMNMSFASFRLTDASEFWNGFSIAESQSMDPLLHVNSVSVQPRPLIRNLLENATYQRMYLAHMRTIMEENFSNQDYFVRAQAMQTLIDNSVLADTNKFYPYSDFITNLTATTTDLVDYPGITELMDARAAYLDTFPGFQGAPTITAVQTNPTQITLGDTLWFTANVTDASTVVLAYRTSENDLFKSVTMLDDGTQNDGGANDNVYGISLEGIGNSIEYYLYAENGAAGRFAPERAAYEFYTLESEVAAMDFVINECLASNSFSGTDEDNDTDDWIEFYNNTIFDVSTGGMYLSDDRTNLNKWTMPDVTVGSDKYLVVWADEEGDEGILHANFQLLSAGESLYLSYANGTIIDSVVFGAQRQDISYGRYPNGTGEFQEMGSSIGASNYVIDETEPIENGTFEFYPNPATDVIYITVGSEQDYTLDVITADGKQVAQASLVGTDNYSTFYTTGMPAGLYFLVLSNSSSTKTQKLILIK